MNPKINKTDAEWRAQLTSEQYRICRRKGTEPAFTGAGAGSSGSASAEGCPKTPAPKTIADAATNLTQVCEDFTVSSKSFAPRPPKASCSLGYDGRSAFDVPTVGRVDGQLVNAKQTDDFQSPSVTWHHVGNDLDHIR